MQIRLAEQRDSASISELFRLCVPDGLQFCTVLCSPKVETFIADQIATQSADVTYVVAAKRDSVLGAAEFRRTNESLFLNYLAVKDTARQFGLGRRILLEGVEIARTEGQSTLSLDVFDENRLAQEWYQRLGLRLQGSIYWGLTSIPASSPRAAFVVEDLYEANRIHARYGFSTVRVATDAGYYPIGRIGEHLMRLKDAESLSDAGCLAAIHQLRHRRQIMVVDHNPMDGPILARSNRMTGSIETVLERLNRN